MTMEFGNQDSALGLKPFEYYPKKKIKLNFDNNYNGAILLDY